MSNQPVPTQNSGFTPRHIAFAAVILVVGVAFTGWKIGWFGGASTGAPSSAAAGSSADRAGNDLAKQSDDLKQQKIDAALDAAGRYVNADQLGEAEKILEALLEKNPRNPAVLRQTYELRLFQKRYEDAYAAIRALLELEGQDPEQFFNAGTIAFQLKNFTQAEAHYKQAAALDARRVAAQENNPNPSAPTIVPNPKYPLYLAQAQVKLHSYDEAKIQLLKVLQIDAAVHEAYGTLAEIALIENKLDLAEQNVTRARAIAPDFFHWRIIEAKVIRRKNDPEEALRRLNAITDPNFSILTEVIDEKAKCWSMLGKPELAAQEYVEQLNLYPDAWLSAVRASEYFSLAGNDTQAQLWYLHAKKRAPNGAKEITDLAKRFATPPGDNGG